MSTVQAWQSTLQQLKQMRKLAGKYRQHRANGNTEAAAGVADSNHELQNQVASSTSHAADVICPYDECEEVVVRLKVGRM
jgi:hypothetical protein